MPRQRATKKTPATAAAAAAAAAVVVVPARVLTPEEVAREAQKEEKRQREKRRKREQRYAKKHQKREEEAERVAENARKAAEKAVRQAGKELCEPDDDLLCPITLDLMRDPVQAADGRTYERDAIEDWLRQVKPGKIATSPITNAELPHTTLTPNADVLARIDKWRADN